MNGQKMGAGPPIDWSENSLNPLIRRIDKKIAQMEHDIEALRKLAALIENEPAAVDAVLAGLQAIEQR